MQNNLLKGYQDNFQKWRKNCRTKETQINFLARTRVLSNTTSLFPLLSGFFFAQFCSSAGKESACNAGDAGLGRSPEEERGYPLQYSCASLVAQTVKNPHAMQETWVQSLGWEDPLEEGMATHSSILAWRIPMDRGAWQATVHGSQRVRHDWVTELNW